MKLLLVFGSIISIIALGANNVYGISVFQNQIQETGSFQIGEQYISSAKLLEEAIMRYAKNIDTTLQNENIELDTTSRGFLQRLSRMKEMSIAIQKKSISENQAIIEIKRIIQELKKINYEFKPYLSDKKKKRRNKIQETQKKYVPVLRKISSILDTIIDRLSNSIISQERPLPTKQKEIGNLLLKLNTKNEELKKFSQKYFNSEKNMQKYLKNTIQDISTIMRQLRNLSR